MGRRQLTTAVTLLVLVGILVLGVMLGMKSLFAPLPAKDVAAASPSPTCSPKTVKKGQRIRSAQVQVSVFNGGSRSGLADETLKALKRRGFTAGDVGNAPPGAKVKRVRVLTTEKNDTAAQLVAQQFGRKTQVVRSAVDLGPGVDVIVGDGFAELAKARHGIVAKRSTTVCVPLPEASRSTGTSGL